MRARRSLIHDPPRLKLSNKPINHQPMTDPMTHGIIALAVLALLCGMRRRRTGPSDETLLDQKRQSYGRWPR